MITPTSSHTFTPRWERLWRHACRVLFFAIFLQPTRLPPQKMGLCAEERFQISIRPLALVRQRSCVKEHAKFSGSIPAAYDRYRGPILFQP
jgi:hypothetical protein